MAMFRPFSCPECDQMPWQEHKPACSHFPEAPLAHHCSVDSCDKCGVVGDIDYTDGVFDEVLHPDEWPEGAGYVNPLHNHMKDTFDLCLAISIQKNADYAGDEDPLANFRACQSFGVPMVRGIMVRLSDKMARIGNLLDKEASVKDEKIADSIDDAINYLAILKYALETE